MIRWGLPIIPWISLSCQGTSFDLFELDEGILPDPSALVKEEFLPASSSDVEPSYTTKGRLSRSFFSTRPFGDPLFRQGQSTAFRGLIILDIKMKIRHSES